MLAPFDGERIASSLIPLRLGRLPPVPFICTYPLIDPNTVWYGRPVAQDFYGAGGGSCAIPCPPPLYTTDEYDSTTKMFETVSIISFVCSFWFGASESSRVELSTRDVATGWR